VIRCWAPRAFTTSDDLPAARFHAQNCVFSVHVGGGDKNMQHTLRDLGSQRCQTRNAKGKGLLELDVLAIKSATEACQANRMRDSQAVRNRKQREGLSDAKRALENAVRTAKLQRQRQPARVKSKLEVREAIPQAEIDHLVQGFQSRKDFCILNNGR